MLNKREKQKEVEDDRVIFHYQAVSTLQFSCKLSGSTGGLDKDHCIVCVLMGSEKPNPEKENKNKLQKQRQSFTTKFIQIAPSSYSTCQMNTRHNRVQLHTAKQFRTYEADRLAGMSLSRVH